VRLRSSIIVALCSLLWTTVCFAQIDRGAILGTVVDASGAAIPAASITITNEATHVSESTITNADGQYQVLGLIPGLYTVGAKAKGLEAQSYPHVEIHVQTRAALNFRLQVGNVSETVTVSSQAPQLQTESAEMGGVVGSQTVNDLPLNGRAYAPLAMLEAGVNKYYSGPNESIDRFSINGNSEMQNYFALDGVDNNSASTNQQDNYMEVVQPPPDAIEEFKVQVRTYSAEFGNAAGGVINVSTKSGTNHFHGDVWNFLRNDKLDSNTFFNNLNGVKRGHFTQNQYGGVLGGPIRRDRSFFFVDFQGLNSRQAVTETATVPTPLMKNSYNFMELPYTVSSVVPGQSGCIVNNVVQENCLDSTALKLLTLYPDPNISSAVLSEGVAGSFSGGSNYQYVATHPNDTYSGDARIDHNLNERNHISGHFSISRITTIDPPWTANGLAGASNWSADNMTNGEALNLAWSDTLSPTLFNDLHFGYNRMYTLKEPPGASSLGTSRAPDYGLTGMPVTPYSVGLPPINIDTYQALGVSRWRPQEQVSNVDQTTDNLIWLRGRHSLKFGYQYYRLNNSFLDIEAPQGVLTASGIYTNNKDFGLSDFLLGDMSLARYAKPFVPHTFTPGHSLYAQDDWRVNDRLTLNLGLRYELYAPLLEHDNKMVNFSADDGGSLVQVSSGATSWKDRSLISPDRNDFAPRVGFAYQQTSRIVVRGGFAIFYQHHYRYGSESMLSFNPPYLVDTTLSQNQGSTTPVFYLSKGFPISTLNSTSTPLYDIQIRAQDPNQRTAYVEQTSFGVQTQLTKSNLLSVDYVGNFSHKFARIANLNQGKITGTDVSGNPIVMFPYSNLNNGNQHAFLEYASHSGNGSFNALEISLRHAFANRYSYGVSYTLSHNIADFNPPINGDYLPQNIYNMAPERSNNALDNRQRFVANGIWALPIGKGGWVLNEPSHLSSILGGWQVNAIVTLQTGNPFTITANDMSETGGHNASRANRIGDPFSGATSDPHKYVQGGSGFFINPASYSNPGVGQFGNTRPFSIYGPGFENVDLSLFKTFPITDRMRTEFRAESFNAFNHANFDNPNSSISDPGSFGKVYSTVNDPREIQLALKLYF